MGWEPVESTQHIYKNGKLYRAITTREPEWDSEQVELLLAAEAYKSDLGAHGHLLSKATDPGADPNDYNNPLRYVAHGPFTDWAEKARLDKIDAYRRSFPEGTDVNMNGMFFTVEEIEG